MKLIYVNELGPNYLGNNVYEFIFGYSDCEPFGDGWDTVPAYGNAHPPELQYISKVGSLKESNLKLHLIQNSDYFCVYDSVEDVIALSWEDAETDEILKEDKTRLVFRYGESLEVIIDKLYERDLILEFDKMTNLIKENEE